MRNTCFLLGALFALVLGSAISGCSDHSQALNDKQYKTQFGSPGQKMPANVYAQYQAAMTPRQTKPQPGDEHRVGVPASMQPASAGTHP
jgi:hypothetical protein